MDSVTDGSDTQATALKKSGFFGLAASTTDAPTTDRAVMLTIARDVDAVGEIRHGQIVLTEPGNAYFVVDDGGTLGTWSQIATTAGSQTLTNKVLTSPDINTPDIDGGTIDGTVIGGSTAAAGSFTTLNASGATTLSSTLGVTGAAHFTAGLSIPQGVGLSLDGVGGNTYMYSSSDVTYFVNNGANSFNISATGAANFAGDVTLSDGRMIINESAANDGLRVNTNNASFGGATFIGTAARAATSAYQMLALYSSSTSDLEFNLRGDGNAFCDGSWTGGGADLSEAMEWSDGNPQNEDRRGFTVTPDYDKILSDVAAGKKPSKYIKPASAGDLIIGIVSANAAIKMGGGALRWAGKFLTDEFDEVIREDYTVTEWTESIPAEIEEKPMTWQKPVMESYDEIVPAVTEQQAVINEETDEPEIITVVVGEETTRKAERQKTEPVTETVTVPEAIVDGVLIPEHEETKTTEKPMFTTENVVDEFGAVVMESVTIKEAEEIKHSYESDKIPEGLAVPDDAVVLTQDEEGNTFTRRVLNPDYDPDVEHTAREDRPEWCDVNIAGFSPVLNGQPVNDNWIDFGVVGPNTKRYLVR